MFGHENGGCSSFFANKPTHLPLRVSHSPLPEAIMLNQLSTELVELIASHLAPHDLHALRLVCRSLRERSSTLFGRAFFHTVETNLSAKSLARLRGISEHGVFAYAVRWLRISQDEGLDDGALGSGVTWSRVGAAGQERKAQPEEGIDADSTRSWSGFCGLPLFRRAPAASQDAIVLHTNDGATAPLDLSSVAVRDFQAVLRRLEKCDTIELHDVESQHPPRGPLLPTDVLHLILATIAAGHRPARTLRISLLRKPAYTTPSRLPPLPPQPHQLTSALGSPLASLAELALAWNLSDALAPHAAALVAAAPALRTLRLNWELSPGVDRFYALLAAAPALPPLEVLAVEWSQLGSLAAFARVAVRLAASLRVLEVSLVGLQASVQGDGDGDGGLHGHGHGHGQARQGRFGWPQYFSALAAARFPRLERVCFHTLSGRLPDDGLGGLGLGYVYFCPLRVRHKALGPLRGKVAFSLTRRRHRLSRRDDDLKFCADGVRFEGSVDEMRLFLGELADGGHYVVDQDGRPASPGLPDVGTTLHDGVGTVGGTFDYVNTLKAVMRSVSN
jgi:hypothetical protein